MFIFGVFASIIGNVIIGAGQTLQKYALNQLRPNMPRWQSTKWVLGLLMAYFGEIGNMVGITFATASIVSPLGIVSVFTNAILASIMLNENIKGNNAGYFWILTGVGVILMIAPRESHALEVIVTADQWINFMLFSSFLYFICFLFILATIGAYFILSSTKARSMPVYIVCGSTFGSISILCAKLLTHSSKIVYGDYFPYSHILFLFLALSLAVGGQEVMKQMALSRFDVSKLQPQYYATYNIFVVLTSAIIFQEIQGSTLDWLIFFSLFTVGILLIVRGSQAIQASNSNLDNKKHSV